MHSTPTSCKKIIYEIREFGFPSKRDGPLSRFPSKYCIYSPSTHGRAAPQRSRADAVLLALRRPRHLLLLPASTAADFGHRRRAADRGGTSLTGAHPTPPPKTGRFNRTQLGPHRAALVAACRPLSLRPSIVPRFESVARHVVFVRRQQEQLAAGQHDDPDWAGRKDRRARVLQPVPQVSVGFVGG